MLGYELGQKVAARSRVLIHQLLQKFDAMPFKVVCERHEKFRQQPVTQVPFPAEPEPLGFSRHLGVPSPAENDVRQRAVLGAKHGLNRATLDAQKVRKINDFVISGVLATDQKVRSSNLFGRAIFLDLV